MARSICYCEPKSAKAGEVSIWKFVYTTATDLPKGTSIKFDLLSQGRPFDWQIPELNIKEKTNVIWGKLPSGRTVKAFPSENISAFEFTLPSPIKAKQSFTILIGTLGKGASQKGNTCQQYIQRRRPFNIFIDPKGKKNWREPEQFHLDVKGNLLKNLKIIAPSFTSKNRRFDVTVRFEDEYGNLTNNAPEGTLIELSYDNLRENLNWKLFVPETGFITLPNLYFNEEGIYKIKLKVIDQELTFYSPPIKCFAESELNLFWGLLHGESERMDSAENIESCLRHFRDEEGFYFYSTSSFDSEEETSLDVWKNITHQVEEFNEEDRFVSFLGFQWEGIPKEEGLRHLIYYKDNKPILRRQDLKSNSLKKIYKTSHSKDLISIPCFTMGERCSFDFQNYSPEYERVVEIYNAWGSSECTAKEGNLRPIKESKRKVAENAEGSLQTALQNNCRFGFVAGGLDDRGVYSNFYDTNQVQYSPGLTAIIAKEHSREALMDALHNRSCYATTGKKIVVDFNIAGQSMGSQLNTASKPGLVYNRHISGFVIGTCPIEKIFLICNGSTLKIFEPKENYFEFILDDSRHLSKSTIKLKEKPPFVYYYLRVVQEDGHIAWGSPIWVDHIEQARIITVKKKKSS